ncbi:MAG TPA: hypothetical protein EYN91_10975 [Candidatus Melainabacteria bacterium]|nr:hypothetical protein [Candidatus Melainabacteria bacterium]
MNQISTGTSDTNPLTKERILNFSVAAGSMWITRHLLFGMVFYFMICQIPGIMVKADLFRCVCISLLLSMIFFLVTTALALLGSLSYVTYKLMNNSEEFLNDNNSPNLEWMKDKRFVIPFIVLGVIFNAVLLKAFASFYPNLIMVEGWTPAMLAAVIIVIANRSLHALQKYVVKLSLTDEIKTASGRA